jgi:osmotically-inducible protein OsmY
VLGEPSQLASDVGESCDMNQLMTIERADGTERAHTTLALRSRDNPVADPICDKVAVAILSRFQSHHNFEIRRVNCEVRQGVLVIRGQVSSYYLKQLAQESVRSLAGLSRIVNRLEVVYAPKNSESSEALERQS